MFRAVHGCLGFVQRAKAIDYSVFRGLAGRRTVLSLTLCLSRAVRFGEGGIQSAVCRPNGISKQATCSCLGLTLLGKEGETVSFEDTVFHNGI